MEVTTVSPSPASPTEGADLCETDVSSVAIHSVTLLICLCGLAGNGAVIGLLHLITKNNGIFNLALVDFLFLLFAVPSALLILVEDVSCSPVLPLMYMNFVFQLSVFSCYWTLYRVTWGNSERYIRNFFKLCCCCDPPLRLRPSGAPSSSSPRSATSLSSSLGSWLSSSASGISCRSSVTWLCPSRLFSSSPASTAASNPSSTSWWGGAGGPAPWGPSGSPSRGSLRGRKKKKNPKETQLHAKMMPRGYWVVSLLKPPSPLLSEPQDSD
ncbi:uncharacterized protein LOC131084929 [Melospiza georgiana]|uniref:uncharacterized protein LOC131084929 n=1 Tax=Melospiza georgiana TaxID=44398 RepID=UPI0025AD397E|nr:uncharacterized protein LOC131084929 [Melospiza georgiana]